MKKVIVNVPATCGELIEGEFFNEYLIVSTTVDLFNEIEISFDDTDYAEEYMKLAKKIILKKFDRMDLLDRLAIKKTKKIPVSRGFGSSTCDIIAVLVGVSKVLGYHLSNEELSQMATSIEPSDSSYYHNLLLTNPVTGKIKDTLSANIDFGMHIFMGRDTVDSIELYENKRVYSNENIQELERQYYALREGFLKGDLSKIKKASTMSARINQQFLPYAFFNEISEQFDGLIIGHSGSLIGIYDDQPDILKKMKKFSTYYEYVGHHHIYRDGIIIRLIE